MNNNLNITEIDVISFLTGLGVGFVLGLIVHGLFKNKTPDRNTIIVAVVFIWSSSIIVSWFTGRPTPTAVHGLMGLVAGYFFETKVEDIIKRK